jgi:hypothetical protein
MTAIQETYAVDVVILELEDLDKQFDEEYVKQEGVALKEFKDEQIMYDGIFELWDEMSEYPFCCRFHYKQPNEDEWDHPHFELKDPLGLFEDFVNNQTFNILKDDIFEIDNTDYSPSGHLSYTLCEIRRFFDFAERYVGIKNMWKKDTLYNKKIVIWIVSKIMEFLV